MKPRAPRQPQTPFPTDEQLEQMGLVRCKTPGCSCWIDPINVPQRQCGEHQRSERRRRREEQFTNRPRIRQAA
jgi:hypothetical protein